MKKKKIGILIAALSVVGVLAFLFVTYFGKEGISSLEINTTPNLDVFINGKNVGKTPYDDTLPSKHIVLRLGTYEANIDLMSGIKTVVNRYFNTDLSKSSGEILSFEKNTFSYSSLAVISEPFGAEVLVDGVSKGNTPVEINNISLGEHEVVVRTGGYRNEVFKIKTSEGYKLTADVDLIKDENTTNNVLAEKTPQITAKKIVEILKTPNGFLRVRSEPTTSSNEIGEVHSGETYPLLSTDTKNGWFEIAFATNATSSGWISNTYAAVKPN